MTLRDVGLEVDRLLHNELAGNISGWNVTEPHQGSPMDSTVEYKISMWLVRYLLIAVILLGTVGNILSFSVVVSPRMRGSSVNFYLACLACADTGVLCFSGFKTWLRVVTGFEMLHVSAASCRTLTFIFMLSLHLSAWIIVLLTLDRFFVVWFPFKAADICSLKRSRVITVTTLVVLAAYLLHLFWTLHLQEVTSAGTDSVEKKCAPLEDNYFMNGPFNYIKFASYSIIPFLLVLSMNTAIIWQVLRHSSRQENTASPEGVACGSHSNRRLADARLHGSRQVTVMLLMVSFAWLILSAPFTVISIVPIPMETEKARAVGFLAKTCCFMLMYLNHSINFLLYCIAGRKFRRQVQSLFSQMCNRCFSSGQRSSTAAAVIGVDQRFLLRDKKTVNTPLPGHAEGIPLNEIIAQRDMYGKR